MLKIKSAAILYDGKTYEGRSHSEIGLKMVRDGVCPEPYPGGEAQGFVTECGRFLRREAALSVALRAGQVTRGNTIHSRKLFSEDLR